ncbi:MAG: Hsp20/alpha crystallin family protein [Syntrophales bacterium]
MFGPVWRFGRIVDLMPEVQRLQREMNRLFSGVSQPFSQDFPAINVWSGENEIVVSAELPGADPDGMDISVVGESMTLSGVRNPEALKEGENYHRQERSSGRFSRTLQLPFRVNAANVAARFEKGILQITLPRAEADKPRKISIKAE